MLNINILSKKFFKEFIALVATVGILQYLAVRYDLYWSVNEFDSVMHFLGGAMVGMGFLFGFYFSGFFNPRPADVTLWRFFVIAILGTIFVSVAWEIYELLAGTAMAGEDNYRADTTIDYVMDGLGSLVACLYAFSREVSMEKEQVK